MVGIGWSFGDIVAGINVVWNIYQALSDGPLSARLEFSQFFDEFAVVIGYLGDWESQAKGEQVTSTTRLHQQLRQQCETFIKRHMLLIQEANPQTQSSRNGRSTWLKYMPFSSTQIDVLYQKVQWPLERKEVTRLRLKLLMFLEMATHSVTVENKNLLLDIKASNAALQESNLRLVSSHLEFVSQITQNLKQVVHSSGNQTSQIDSFKLRRFEEALFPPPPLLAIEANPAPPRLPFRLLEQGQSNERQHELILSTPATTRTLNSNPSTLHQEERVISERLENLFKRSGLSIAETGAGSRDTDVGTVVQQVLERLSETRTKIGEAVGLQLGATTQANTISMVDDPQRALQHELGVWNQFEERVQYEYHRRENVLAQAAANPARASSFSLPIPIPPRAPSSERLSPMSRSPTGNSNSGDSYGSPDSMLSHHRNSSVSSASTPASINLERSIPVFLQYEYKTHQHEIRGAVQSLSRTEDGDVHTITTLSNDGLTEIRHCLDRATSQAETSMKPFLDNGHVDKIHKFRVLFQGSHVLRLTRSDGQVQHKSSIRCSPVYRFWNRKEDPSSLLQAKLNYMHFQELLLGKQIALLLDVALINTSSKKDPQCRLGTIRILVDQVCRTRSIFYFRKAKDQIPAFVEWSTTLFKEPKEPGPNCKSLSLESVDGRSLSVSGGALSRRSTQGSVTTIGSLETPTIAFSRIQERSGIAGKSIKGLVIDFYDPKDCHTFWKQFITKEIQYNDFGFTTLAELP